MASTQELPINISNQLPCEWGGASGLGPRKENQDEAALAPKDDPRIRERGVALVVCDGVGGEVGGKTAARIAAQTTLESYYGGVPTDPNDADDKTVIPISDDSGDDTTAALEAAIHHANRKVKAEALNIAKNANMATTVVAAVVRNGLLYTTHVGDSRAYLFHANGNVERVTRDHSWVAEQVAAGVLTEEEARQSAMRVVVTRSLGSASNNTPESNKRILQAGDRVLLCSDGLYGTLSDAKMAEIMRANRNPSDAAKALVKAALPTTTDNTTAVVLNYGQVPKVDKQQPASKLLVVGGLVLAVLGIIGLILWMQNRPKNANSGDSDQPAPAPMASQPPQPAPNNATAVVVNTPEAISPTQAATSSPGATSTLAPTLVATATVLASTQRPNVTVATTTNKTPTPKPIATQPKPTANATATNTVTSTEAIIAATTTPNDANLLIAATPTKNPTATVSASPIPATPTRTPIRPAILPLPKPPAPPAKPAKPNGT